MPDAVYKRLKRFAAPHILCADDDGTLRALIHCQKPREGFRVAKERHGKRPRQFFSVFLLHIFITILYQNSARVFFARRLSKKVAVDKRRQMC